MRNYLMTILSAIGIFAATTTVEATPQSGPYASVLGGVSFFDADNVNHLHLDTSTGYMLGGALGYKFCSPIRVEGEFAYRHNTIDSIRYMGEKYDVDFNINTYTYMFNAYYDIETGSPITPYFGAGLGYVHSEGKVKVMDQSLRTSSDGFGAQFMVGANYAINCKTDIGLEYRYLLAHSNANDHGILLNLRRYF